MLVDDVAEKTAQQFENYEGGASTFMLAIAASSMRRSRTIAINASGGDASWCRDVPWRGRGKPRQCQSDTWIGPMCL